MAGCQNCLNLADAVAAGALLILCRGDAIELLAQGPTTPATLSRTPRGQDYWRATTKRMPTPHMQPLHRLKLVYGENIVIPHVASTPALLFYSITYPLHTSYLLFARLVLTDYLALTYLLLTSYPPVGNLLLSL